MEYEYIHRNWRKKTYKKKQSVRPRFKRRKIIKYSTTVQDVQCTELN